MPPFRGAKTAAGHGILIETRSSRRCGPPRTPAVSFSHYFSVRAPAQKKRVHLPHVRVRDDTRHALPVVVAVGIAGALGLAFAIVSVASGALSWGDAAGVAVLLAAATAAEAFPVPIEGVAAGTTSLATIFVVAAAATYGWAAGAIVGFLTMAFVEMGRRRPLSRVVFNSGAYVVAGIAAGAAASTADDG